MNKIFVIAAVLMAAVLTGTLSPGPAAFAQGALVGNQFFVPEQVIIGSGESTSNSCSLNSGALEVDSPTALGGATAECEVTSALTDSPTLEETPSAPEIE